MAAGDTVQGERAADVRDGSQWHDQLEPGQYRRVNGDRGLYWECRPPDWPPSVGGSLAKHEVTEHEDGTITVSPSILSRSTWRGEPIEWHGYLERGVWREV